MNDEIEQGVRRRGIAHPRRSSARLERPGRSVVGLVLATAATFFASSAWAQDAATPGESEEAPVDDPTRAEEPVMEVVVTGARHDERRSEAVVATEVIRRREIEQSGARDVAELLEERPDVQVVRSFRGSELWLRGLDPEYTLVLVDGDRVPGRIGGAVDLSRYGVENVERVEIVRGPSSALYGSDAIGGVVNVLTRESTRPVEADALASYGSRNVIDGTARIAVRPTRAFRAQVTGGVHRADAFGRDDLGVTDGSSRNQWSAGGRIELRPDDDQRIRVQADYLRLTLGGVDAGAGGALFDRTQLQEQLQASVEQRVAVSGQVRLQNRFTYAQFREQYAVDQRGGTQLDRYEDNREHLGQLSTILDVRPSSAHSTTLGFDELLQVLDSERLVRSGRRFRLALFAQHEWRAFDRGDARIVVVPGVRVDLDSQFGERVSPKIALRADANDHTVLRASYGRGFRAPSFQELLLRFENPTVGYVVEGNPTLRAETSDGVDVGIEWRREDWLDLGVTLFRNDLRDMIAVVTLDDGNVPGTTYSYENLERAWTMGAETSVVARADFVTVRAGYALTETHDGENDRRLEGRARHRVTASTRLSYDPWELELVARAAILIDRTYYVDTDGNGEEEATRGAPLAQIDARVAKSFESHVEIFFGIDNLLDAGDAFSTFRPRTFYAGARGRYGRRP